MEIRSKGCGRREWVISDGISLVCQVNARGVHWMIWIDRVFMVVFPTRREVKQIIRRMHEFPELATA